MKKAIAIAAFTVVCGAAFAQNAGPAPQTGMEKPGMTNGAKEDGSMDTTGMSGTTSHPQPRLAAMDAKTVPTP